MLKNVPLLIWILTTLSIILGFRVSSVEIAVLVGGVLFFGIYVIAPYFIIPKTKKCTWGHLLITEGRITRCKKCNKIF